MLSFLWIPHFYGIIVYSRKCTLILLTKNNKTYFLVFDDILNKNEMNSSQNHKQTNSIPFGRGQ